MTDGRTRIPPPWERKRMTPGVEAPGSSSAPRSEGGTSGRVSPQGRPAQPGSGPVGTDLFTRSGVPTRPDVGTRIPRPLDPRLAAWLTQLQFEINCASSVAIEVPALRPYAEALRGN